MKKSVFSVMLILLLLAGLVVATGAAGDEPEEVRIYPWLAGLTYDILPGQVGVIRYGWAACNPGLVGVFIGASNFEETLEGELILMPEDVDGLWGEIQIFEELPPFAEDCMGKGRPASAHWQHFLTALDPGVYELRSRMWMDHTLVDGADNDGDGKIDVFRPEDLYYDTVNTIIVHDGE